jgi:hypothetical protein
LVALVVVVVAADVIVIAAVADVPADYVQNNRVAR